MVAVGVEDLELGAGGGVADRHPHEEPVELGLGQRVGALVLDRVLGGDDHERRRQRVGHAVDGDLVLGHGLEQRGLGLGRGPVDLVGQHDVVEHRPGPEVEGVVAPVPHREAHHVGGQQVGGELHPAEAALDRRGQRLGQVGLAHARDVLEQQVALGHQAQQHQLDDVALALDDALDVGDDRCRSSRRRSLPGAPRSRCWPQPRSPSVVWVSQARLRARHRKLTRRARAVSVRPTRGAPRWRSTSAAPSWRSGGSIAGGVLTDRAAGAHARPTGGRRGHVGTARRPGRRGRARGDEVVVGVGCGGPMAPGRRAPCRRSTSRRGAASRCGPAWPS